MILEYSTLSGKKLQILDEAQQLFSKKGFSDASMRDLAKVLEIKPASLYSHFRSKEEILWVIAMRCGKEFHSEIDPIYLSHLNPREKLQLMIEAHIRVIIRNIDAAAVFFKEWRHLKEPLHADFSRLRLSYEEKFVDIIGEGAKNGSFDCQDPAFATLTLLSAINWIHKWYHPDGKMTEKQISDQISGLLLAGITSRTSN